MIPSLRDEEITTKRHLAPVIANDLTSGKVQEQVNDDDDDPGTDDDG